LFKFITSKLVNSISPKIQNIFLGTFFVSVSKAFFSFLILYLLSNSAEGSITLYGNLQNAMTILISIFGLSVQNGISTHVARSSLAEQHESATPHIIAVIMIGLFVFISVFMIFYWIDAERYTILGFEIEGKFQFYGLMSLGLMGALQLTYTSILVGYGFVVKAQTLELVRVGTIAVLIALSIYFSLRLNLFVILIAGYAFVGMMMLRAFVSSPKLNWRPKFDVQTYKILKTGVVTAYCGILVASVNIFVRSNATDYGSYELSDVWEIFIRVIAIYQLIIALPLGQILLRTYARADISRTGALFRRGLPFLVFPLLFVLVVPEFWFRSVFEFLFNKEIQNIKLICIIIIAAETLRTLGMFFHNFLVSRAKIFPQILFETINQLIVVAVVMHFSSADNFILHYALGYLLASLSWLLCNFLYIRYFWVKQLPMLNKRI
jgi:hypothetical protein